MRKEYILRMRHPTFGMARFFGWLVTEGGGIPLISTALRVQISWAILDLCKVTVHSHIYL